ncbi:MAG: DUF5777 family beta-barrel protein, partial [Terriglobales bacterium]
MLPIITILATAGVTKDEETHLTPKLPFNVVFGAGGSTVVVEQNGKRYEIDTSAKTVRELSDERSSSSVETARQTTSGATGTQQVAASPTPSADANYFTPGDDRLLTLPSGQRITRHALWVNFSHRFPFSPAFRGPALGHTLIGLDDFAVPSFGFQYGITDRFSVAAYRSPTILGRPIELRAAYRLLDERDHQPFNATFRFSIDGANDFTRNFTTNFELIASKSIGSRAQFVLVPTLSIHNRPAILTAGTLRTPPREQPCGQALANGVPVAMQVKPCADSFALGIGFAIDVRPTIALIAEVNPTVVNARNLGIHRPPFGFAIQKKIWRHAFTLGFTTAPGTTVAQRSQTRSIFLLNPAADKFSG